MFYINTFDLIDPNKTDWTIVGQLKKPDVIIDNNMTMGCID